MPNAIDKLIDQYSRQEGGAKTETMYILKALAEILNELKK